MAVSSGATTVRAATSVASGAATVRPGYGRPLPETQNVGRRLTYRLHNSALEILAVYLADGRPRLPLHRHRDQGLQFAGRLVPYDTHRADLAEGAERVAQGVFACLARQVCYTDVHLDSLPLLLVSRVGLTSGLPTQERHTPTSAKPFLEAA
jgi:hypothetical protein